MNEHKIYDAGKPLKLEKLVGFFAATNQIPERDELAALKDRFVIKVEVPAVQQALFDDLIDAGMRNELNKADGTTPWVIPGTIAVSDFGNVRQFLTDTLRRRNDEAPETAKLPPEVHRAYRRLVSDLGAHGVVLSDREVIRLYRLIMLHGYLFHGRMPDTVQLSDLGVMRYVAESEDQFEVVRKCVDDAIGAER